MKVLFVFGTRPEAIKMVPVIRELKRSPGFEVVICSTGQHREMLYQVLDFFGMVPDLELDIMKHNQTLVELSSGMITAIDRVLSEVAPDVTLVQGDTTTTFIASLCSFYRGIPVGHIEAGLRSGEKRSPFPEEMNRSLTTFLADIHFAPTKKAHDQLLMEGVLPGCAFLTGNTVIDALLWASEIVDETPGKMPEEGLSSIDFTKKVVLITSHRRENFGKPLLDICDAVAELSKDGSLELVYPVHLNPNVQEPVYSALKGHKNIHLLKPLSYPGLVYLMKKSHIILTDSGGIQEEAPSLGKPVLVMRDVTERPEGIEKGVAKLVGTSHSRIVSEVRRLIEDEEEYERMATGANPYGDGKASVRIREILQNSGAGPLSGKTHAGAHPSERAGQQRQRPQGINF